MIIAEHEAALFACMGMQVNVNGQLAHLVLLLYRLFDGPNCRLESLTRIEVVAIQVLSHRVESIVPTIDTIWVEHWHHLEYEAIAQDFRLWTVLVC